MPKLDIYSTYIQWPRLSRRRQWGIGFGYTRKLFINQCANIYTSSRRHGKRLDYDDGPLFSVACTTLSRYQFELYLSDKLCFVADLPTVSRLRSSTSRFVDSWLSGWPLILYWRTTALEQPILEDVQSASSMTTFRRKLKLHLFRQSYSDVILFLFYRYRRLWSFLLRPLEIIIM